jgi:hypothetical protein
VIAASAAGLVAYRLGQNQISVARAQAHIAERTWQTANEKIVLELFERRLNIYEEVRRVIGEITRSGDATNDALFRYGAATDRAPYFFGPEVQTYLEQIRLHLIDLQLANQMMANDLNPERPQWVQSRHDHFIAVTAFYKDAPPLFAPYLQAHQKVDAG